MKTMSIAMMMRLLSGIKVIKNGRLRKQRLRKNFRLLLGIDQGGGIGVFLEMKKNETEKL